MCPRFVFLHIPFSSYGLCMIAGLALALVALRYQSKLFGFPYLKLYALTIYSGLGGVIGANLLDNVLNFRAKAGIEWFDFINGHMFYGFFFGAIAIVFILSRHWAIPPLTLLNSVIPAWVMAQICGRVGCFLAGCCYGTATDIAWAVTYTAPLAAAPLGKSLHPVQLYEALGLIAIMAGLYLLQKKNHFRSSAFLWYAFTYALLRFFIEFLRGDNPPLLGPLTPSQSLSIFILTVVLSFSRFRKILFSVNPFNIKHN